MSGTRKKTKSKRRQKPGSASQRAIRELKARSIQQGADESKARREAYEKLSKGRKYRGSRRDSNPILSLEIIKFLERNPYEDIGKFGVPQDKYRYGSYGSKSMVPDIWRKTSSEKINK